MSAALVRNNEHAPTPLPGSFRGKIQRESRLTQCAINTDVVPGPRFPSLSRLTSFPIKNIALNVRRNRVRADAYRPKASVHAVSDVQGPYIHRSQREPRTADP
ncbi:hypothetical protein EVAR_94800_1 [Eumeta japonica]|uniref:Uncharacterized protein n=1 Tax=Eumeta variegata TaxID=151549 RepID=A0A4C1UII4_EUMVA|nr:hypothetical protein EVAR_94800_1 [Eumeta japonica]